MRALAIFLLAVGLLLGAPQGARADSLSLEPGRDIYWLPPHLEMFEDASQALSIDQVLATGSFAPMKERGFGRAASAYWVRFDYTSPQPPQSFYLFLGYKPTTVDLYVVKGGKTIFTERSGQFGRPLP